MRINPCISPTDASYPTGMMFFPTKMMEGYKAGTFKGDGNTFFLFAMGIFGLSIMGAAVTNSTMMRLRVQEGSGRAVPRQLHVLDDVPPERRLQGGLGFHAQGVLRRRPPQRSMATWASSRSWRW